MDDAENKIAPQPESSDVQAQVDSLQNLVISVLVLLIVISGTVWIYLRWQVKYINAELEGNRPRMAMFVSEYNKSTGPATDEFIRRLVDFGKTHPDFTPVLAKYGIKTTGPTSAPPANLSPLPKK